MRIKGTDVPFYCAQKRGEVTRIPKKTQFFLSFVTKIVSL